MVLLVNSFRRKMNAVGLFTQKALLVSMKHLCMQLLLKVSPGQMTGVQYYRK